MAVTVGSLSVLGPGTADAAAATLLAVLVLKISYGGWVYAGALVELALLRLFESAFASIAG
jgi:hypothetical protein